MASPVFQLPSLDIGSPAEPTRDPRRVLRAAIKESPISWIPELHSYLVVRRADVLAVLKDDRLVSLGLSPTIDRLPEAQKELLRPVRESITSWMGHTVPEDHRRFQSLLKRYFTRRTMEGMRPKIEEITRELTAAARPNGRMEVVAELANPLPASVIAEMLGLPRSDRELVLAWSRDIVELFRVTTFDRLEQAQRSVLAMQDHIRPVLDARRHHPTDDLLSAFAAAERDGLISEQEIAANCVLLLFAGHLTTAALITSGLALLLENPDQLALLRADPGLTPGAVDEAMRIDGPVSVTGRTAIEQFEVGGHTFPAGANVYLALSAANNDPDTFDEPDRFDITRPDAGKHVGFGVGLYYCLGAALARIEAEVCFRVLLEEFPELALAAPPDRRPKFPLDQTLVALHVTF